MVYKFLNNEVGGANLEFSLIGFLAFFSIFVIFIHFHG
jgi:hypothetical protein